MKTSRLITLVKESLADDPIEFVDASTDWQSPFRLARRCKGVALQHSVALDALDPMLFEGLVMELAEDYVPGPEVALEAFFEAWHICTPEGSDPLAEAASISRITMLPGRWPTPRLTARCAIRTRSTRPVTSSGGQCTRRGFPKAIPGSCAPTAMLAPS